ncbi:unnamed protein product [Brachionus calyciflorus]|uniref:Uncharacterized protein n=1 Tax=Brachionus calyciflorus TaxID=104777 RepID=A0A813MGZ8_9BILA|nr:unnamed protein product [Brachionus calyciflorus]
MMSNIANNSNFDENLLLSLPAHFANNSRLIEHNINENLNPLTTQNYNEKYKDLENVLAEEKKTNEELQKYYKVLKNDHTRIKNEAFDLKSQMQTLIEENKIMQDKYKSMFEKMQQELRRKQLFIEELKTRELDDVKLDRLKEELSQQIEGPYKDIVRQLEQELQKIQSECNRLRQESGVLKSANEHEKTEHHNYLEQLKLKQEIELNALRKDRDILRQKLQENNQAEALKIKEVIRENNQHKIKIKSLVEENEELREKIEHIESHNNSLMRNHSKLISDLSTKISVLESEKDSLKQQAENSYKETINLNESLANTIRKLHDTERENTSLKLKFDEVQHNCKRDLANLKLEMVKERGEHGRAKEALNNNIQDLMTKVEIANNKAEIQRKLLEEKDRELSKTINGVNEESWTKITELTNEKIDLESKIQLLTKDYEFKLSSLQVEKDKSDDRFKSFEKQREEIVKENTRLRSLIIDSENHRSELEKEQEKSRDLYRKCHKLETELSSNTNLEQELTEMNMKLKNEVLFHSQEVQRHKDQIRRLKEEYENRLVELKTQHIAERNDFTFKNEDLQSKLNKAMEKINDCKKLHEKKKKQFQVYAKALKMKAESLNAKLKELKLKEQSINQMVPMQAYSKLKAHLDSITSRHQAFREMILSKENYPQTNPNNSFKTISNINFQEPIKNWLEPNLKGNNDAILNSIKEFNTSNSKQIQSLIESFKSSKDQENKDEFEIKLDEISNRMETLDSNQKEHLQSVSKNSIDNLTNRSLLRTPSPEKSRKSTKSEQFTPESKETKPKEIEVKKLSLSSSSSSSTSSISEKIRPDSPTKAKNQLNFKQSDSEEESLLNEKLLSKNKQSVLKEKDSSSYEEDFENLKDSSSDSDDF